MWAADVTDEQLLAKLATGEEAAFTELIERYHPRLLRFAGSFLARRELAEDAVQETWLAVLRGIADFEGRSALRTWLFQICANRARSMASSEQRTIPVDPADLAAEAATFGPDGAWASPPERWLDMLGQQADDADLIARVRQAIEALPAGQRQVITLRDVEGLSAPEVASVLSISAVNQRVLLHRGRTQVRRTLAEAANRR